MMNADDLSKEDLLRHVGELNAENLALREALRQATGETDWTVDRLKDRTRVLNERVKELSAVYETVRLLRDPDLRFEQRVGRIVDLLPRAYQFQEAACARALFGDREFRSNKFQETPWSQNEPILVKGAPAGHIEVRYLRAFPQSDDGPFLREERMLLRVIAQCLGALCELSDRQGS